MLIIYTYIYVYPYNTMHHILPTCRVHTWCDYVSYQTVTDWLALGLATRTVHFAATLHVPMLESAIVLTSSLAIHSLCSNPGCAGKGWNTISTLFTSWCMASSVLFLS